MDSIATFLYTFYLQKVGNVSKGSIIGKKLVHSRPYRKLDLNLNYKSALDHLGQAKVDQFF